MLGLYRVPLSETRSVWKLHADHNAAIKVTVVLHPRVQEAIHTKTGEIYKIYTFLQLYLYIYIFRATLLLLNRIEQNDA